jgi:hypothetical protein
VRAVFQYGTAQQPQPVLYPFQIRMNIEFSREFSLIGLLMQFSIKVKSYIFDENLKTLNLIV